MKIDECTSKTSKKIVKISDSGKIVKIDNKNEECFEIISIDGCALCANTAADFIVRRVGDDWIVVELKGRDIEKATKQIKNTILQYRSSGQARGRMAALIVSNCVPKSIIAQKIKKDFAREFKSPVHVFSSKNMFEFEKLLAF